MIAHKISLSKLEILLTAECAPTLAPWKPPIEVTSESTHQREDHAIYDINDIVHFEDNDIVMRDAKRAKIHDNNKLDNSVVPFKTYSSYNDVKTLFGKDNKSAGVVADVDNELKLEERKEKSCECQHGGGCVANVCLCPLGYAGVKCEITLDLKVPRFNGSSYLRLPGLGSAAESWLDIQITLKPSSGDGLVLYNSERADGDGDFFSLHLRDYYVEFAFDLGAGIALVRSAYPVEPNKWHSVSVSRAGRRATLRVRGGGAARSVTSRGTRRRLALRTPLLLGGAPHPLPARLALDTSFNGCVSQLIINDEELAVVSAALGGLNVDNCDDAANNCTNKKLCKEVLDPVPVYPLNISETEPHHSIVAKKGFKQKMHKSSHKKHSHMDKYKKKKYFISKKHQYLLEDLERNNEVATDLPYDGQTYMQVKYLSDNEVNWGDMNTLVSYSLDINIRFRSVSSHGLLVWSGGARAPPDFLSLAIENSVLVFRYDLGSGEVVIIANHTKVDDGLWHRARATRNRQAGVLEVDGLGSVGKVSPGKLKQLNTENGLYIGGLPSIELNTQGRYSRGLVGCVSQISLSGDFDIPLSLSKLPHTITNNVGRCAP
ncbi:hypothetical protein SFRURICE_010111 [Spodoptera frugiperda]|nr:hypothetical protein SFRURICE_010111 [Spodoptera frugiperda]